MNKHYDNYLTRKYPLLYRNRHGNVTTTLMCWGFACGDGWFNIINALSEDLSSAHENAKRRYEWVLKNDPNNTKAIEECFNYMKDTEKNHPIAVQVKEKFGGLRFYVDGNLSTEQYGAIRFAEALSMHTCEICGDRGTQRFGGWTKTLCNKHASWNRSI